MNSGTSRASSPPRESPRRPRGSGVARTMLSRDHATVDSDRPGPSSGNRPPGRRAGYARRWRAASPISRGIPTSSGPRCAHRWRRSGTLVSTQRERALASSRVSAADAALGVCTYRAFSSARADDRQRFGGGLGDGFLSVGPRGLQQTAASSCAHLTMPAASSSPALTRFSAARSPSAIRSRIRSSVSCRIRSDGIAGEHRRRDRHAP